MRIVEYNRSAAVKYAHRWAYARNPAYYDYGSLGGNCTNFASQCIYAGSRVMNYTPTFGWYYRNAGDKAPAWTGVAYLYNFMTRKTESIGPFGREAPLSEARPGDIVQISFDGMSFQHSPVVVQTGQNPAPENILVAAHTQDADYRPLGTYTYKKLRLIHFLGVRR
ncbi:amidase domain-containing protein [Papillibacter cinnamivorans]|uniref:amidase domain-containing protein n=1 Tax=Papillibacter cinnamivorans TaxID=100176 RepID=UPI000A0232A7|nr:amidase domain-containing protein [Papillibacter cinnamivorans]